MSKLLGHIAIAALSLTMTATAIQAREVVNIYSSRHYDTDERLYSDFTEATGIKVNRIEEKADALMVRLQAEGRNSPADIFLTTDAGRFGRLKRKGSFNL